MAERAEDEGRDQTGSVGLKRVALGLGYFSIALGAVEIAAPGRLARWFGVEGKAARNTIFAFGLREIFAGVNLIRGPAVSFNVWNRVAGDAIDAGALGLAARSGGNARNLALAGGFVAAAAVADVMTAVALDKSTGRTFNRVE